MEKDIYKYFEYSSIHLVYSASTPSQALKQLNNYKNLYGNTSGIHSFAQNMENELEKSRGIVADTLNVKNSENNQKGLYFKENRKIS